MVYFVQALAGGSIKIGKSDDVEQRLGSLQTGSPEPLGLLGVNETAAESALHERFSALRLHGEWFKSDALLLLFIITETRVPPRFVALRDIVKGLRGMPPDLTTPHGRFLIALRAVQDAREYIPEPGPRAPSVVPRLAPSPMPHPFYAVTPRELPPSAPPSDALLDTEGRAIGAWIYTDGRWTWDATPTLGRLVR